ncbi:hypothetical protein Hanom_Chr05g00472571 [Helianthus anomalus]
MFSLCALFFSGPCFFCALRLGPRRGLCDLSAPSAFNNYDVNSVGSDICT